ncbi:MAG: two-component system sensor histidine kinase NtrB [Planctomycetota bacterium]|jgi:signal transduction histidine kinase
MNGKDRKKRVGRLTFLGTLAGGLAHEVKNPLSTISLNLQLLKEDWQDADSPRELRTLKRVDILQREIDRLESIVNDFLHFARGFSLEPRPGKLNELIQEMIDFLTPEANKNSIRITPYMEPGLPEVLMDWNYIQKALLNIFHNAFQAVGEVDQDQREVMVRTRRCRGGVEVEITDTGPGIAPDARDKIFQVFFSTKKGGTGMGLPTVRRIVEEHDGSINVVSDIGKGTSFVLFLPAAGAGKKGKDQDGKKE